MRTAKVVLGGQDYTINEKRSRENAAWRKKLEKPFSELAEMLKEIPDVKLTDGEGLSKIVQFVSSLLLRSVDMIVDLLVDYSPELDGVREEAYDSELLDAFGTVLGFAYPFGGIFNKITQATSKQAKTKPNLP